MEGNKVRCKFCLKVLNGGISRLKYHLSRIPAKGVNPCSKVSTEITEMVKAILAMKEESKEASLAKRQKMNETRSIISNLPLAKTTGVSSPSAGLGVSLPLLRCNNNNNNNNDGGALNFERCVAEFFFENNLDFGVVKSDSYKLMLESIGGPGFKGPDLTALKTVWLRKIKEEINFWIEEIKEDWATTGCTILADSWTDNKNQALINFSISSPLGVFFYKSVDASMYFKSNKCLYEIFDSVIQELGHENVVQIITDNVLSYGNVSAQITQKYNAIFWSPCASVCMNSILEEFCRLDWVNRCIIHAQLITKFIYNNEWVLDLTKRFTNGQELVRTGITKPVSDILTLQSLLKHRLRLKHMFNSQEYTSSNFSNKDHSMSCMDILDDSDLWKSIEEIASVSEPILKVLRDISGCKPGIGSIYESMTKVKDSIRTYFIMDELKCKTFLDIIDRKWRNELHSPLHAAAAYLNPSIQYNHEIKYLGLIKEELIKVLDKLLPTPELMHDITGQLYIFRKAQGLFGSNLAREARSNTPPGIWWEEYGDSARGLQRTAVRILSQVCSCSTLDRNWTQIQQIHSEKRNRLDKELLADLLFVNSNLKLKSKRNSRVDLGDPIEKEEIDMSCEWVQEIETPTQTISLDRFNPSINFSDHIFVL